MFFKSKKKIEEKQTARQADTGQLLEEIKQIKSTLETLKDEKRIEALNNLGSSYLQLGMTDEAIYYYETSLNEKKAMGKAYTDLMQLYNMKRRGASENNDEEAIREYMDKINSLMQLSKDMIRGKT